VADEHIEEIDAYAFHKKSRKKSGCLTRCIQRYQEDDSHSHRWNAARRAWKDRDVYYWDGRDPEGRTWMYRPQATLIRLGATNITHSRGRSFGGGVRDFATKSDPFPNNAHHIIPLANLHSCIDEAAAMAKPNQSRMYNIIVGGLLIELYNINDEPNMIILPTEEPAAAFLGLPTHIGGHSKYRDMVTLLVDQSIIDAYQALADEVADKAHGKILEERPRLRETFEGISNGLYDAIVALSKVLRNQDQALTLDEASDRLRTFYNAP